MNQRLQLIQQQQSKIQKSRNVFSYRLPPLSPKCISNKPCKLLFDAKKGQELDQLNNISKHKLIDILTETSENSLEITQTDLKQDCCSRSFDDQYQHLDVDFL
ncbi:Hypothetical_protein [Hexamita inflata]|uniref:Hypothetical_protein n=1 Tax=Hexamita inflata TaxID=28002 RepID=A0AA86Q6V9_9EUKA|nr:Hypothetical protein HINF_LOCUS40003 [Hexamita inflata]